MAGAVNDTASTVVPLPGKRIFPSDGSKKTKEGVQLDKLKAARSEGRTQEKELKRKLTKDNKTLPRFQKPFVM